jgi:hypothetical protein
MSQSRGHEQQFLSTPLSSFCKRERERERSQWSEFLATDPEVPGSISGAVRFSKKSLAWIGVHTASRGELRSYWNEK